MKSTSPKCNGLLDGAGLRKVAEAGDQILQLLRMARGEQHRMACFDP
jgi:hypothetical protein